VSNLKGKTVRDLTLLFNSTLIYDHLLKNNILQQISILARIYLHVH